MKSRLLPTTICLILLLSGLSSFSQKKKAKSSTPVNILFIIADDWSYPHAGFYGDSVVKTPHFDRIASQGIAFDHAYISSPSCTPSRGSVLTGQHFWRLKEGANLYGPLRPEYPTYPDLLDQHGYHVGYTFKGWGPGQHVGRPRNPAGELVENFDAFLEKRPKGSPFCFWFGSHNPHRGYKKGSGIEVGINPDAIDLPAPFPDSKDVRSDVADYYKEVQDYDAQIGELLEQLEEIGELDQTLIVITSDNGMPFPRCKSNLYDLGTRVPLAMTWGKKIKKPKRIQDFVSLTDLAPTFLELAGIPVPEQMTGKSLLPYLIGEVDTQNREEIFFGKERHVPGQEYGDWTGYPMRAIRTADYLYIRNFRPDLWPGGTPDYEKSTFFPAYYADIDGGPTRSYMVNNREKNAKHAQLFSLAFEKRPAVELYDLNKDPNQLNNVAADPNYASTRQDLHERLMHTLKENNDPRVHAEENTFRNYPYTGGAPFPDHYIRKSRRYCVEKLDDFSSDYISTRMIEVLVPVNVEYDKRFPVLYMFDGQNLFDSFEGWEGKPNKGWRVPRVLDSLITAGTIPPMIVVGIHNGEERMSEYMPAKPQALLQDRIASATHEWDIGFKTSPPASDAQLRFIVEELKPFIDSRYKTKPDQSHTFIAGSSMGGLISAYAICEYPEIFGGAACFSTHWPPLDGVFLEYLKTHLPDPATHKIYFDYGTEGLDASYEPFQHIADEAMRARGYETNKNWITRKYEGAKHHEDDWYKRFHIPVEFLMREED